jgi:DNA-binding transcriptional MerR regulator
VAQLENIPDKPYFRASEVCQLTDTQPYVLRFWESEFPQLAPDRGRGGNVMYRRQDVDIVLRIKKLLYEDEFTIEGARRQLDLELTGDALEAAESAPTETPVPPSGMTERAASVDLAGTDVVPRRRYEDAVEEVELLRLRVREAEANQRRAEARIQRLEESASAERQRIDRALARIDGLVSRLSPRPPA